MIETMWWGVFLGVLSSIVAYNLRQWVLCKQPLSLWYMLHALACLWFVFCFGHVWYRLLDIDIFYDFHALPLLALVITLGMIVRGFLKEPLKDGHRQLAAAVTTYAVAILLYLAGAFTPLQIEVFSLSLVILAGLLMVSLALDGRTRKHQQIQKRQEALLMEQAKFDSVGQTLTGIVHQLKQPIIYVGTLVMALEMKASQAPKALKDEIAEEIVQLRKTVDFMDATIMELYNLYAKERTPKLYDPAEVIEDVVGMLAPTISARRIWLTRTLERDHMHLGFRSSFAHCVLIILNNAIETIKERQIRAPEIILTLLARDGVGYLTISDNAGGIDQDPIEIIFDPAISSRKGLGMGMGLALARRLAEERLDGRLWAENRGTGAFFMLEFPIEKEDRLTQP